jgi:hypothetical protein
MSKSASLKIHANLEGGAIMQDGKLQRYATRLRALDTVSHPRLISPHTSRNRFLRCILNTSQTTISQHSKYQTCVQDGNGEISLDEVCSAIDGMVEQEKQTRLMRKLAIMFGILSLLTTAAVVGLTAGVIILSKDVDDDGNTLVSSSSGQAMATAQFLQTNTLAGVVSNPTPADLSQIKTLVVPGAGDVNYTVQAVAGAVVYNDGSVVVSGDM